MTFSTVETFSAYRSMSDWIRLSISLASVSFVQLAGRKARPSIGDGIEKLCKTKAGLLVAVKVHSAGVHGFYNPA